MSSRRQKLSSLNASPSQSSSYVFDVIPENGKLLEAGTPSGKIQVTCDIVVILSPPHFVGR